MIKFGATFELLDKYTGPITKIFKNTDRTEKSIKNASKACDNLNKSAAGTSRGLNEMNKKLKVTESSADRVANKMNKLFNAKMALRSFQFLTSKSDEFASANARLNNAGVDKNAVYASAQRSRASYTSTANGVSGLMLNARQAFASQDEAIGFVEAINKQFAIYGVEASAAAGAMTQLTQAMGAGALRGDELNSVLEAAPSIARNIEKYMGWAEGSIKSYAEKGMVTAEIVKNAQLSALGDIDKQFHSIPLTWGQVWTKAMNMIMWASQPVLNLISMIAQHMDIIAPIVLAAAAAFGVYSLATFISANSITAASAATWMFTKAQAALNAVMALNPFALAVIGVVALIGVLYAGTAAFNKMTGSSVSATGIIAGAFAMLAAFIYNHTIYPVNFAFAELVNFIGNCFNDPVSAVKVLFLDMAKFCVDQVLNMAKAIENIINKIPGVKVNFTSGLEGWSNSLGDKISKIKDESGWKEYIKTPKMLDYTETAKWGYGKGKGLADKASSFLSGGGYGLGNFDNLGTAGNPLNVKGTGKNGSLNVSLEEEDISYLRELAERDYVARIAQNTLAPNIKVEFTGPITKTADLDDLGPRIGQILRDELDAAPEGAY